MDAYKKRVLFSIIILSIGANIFFVFFQETPQLNEVENKFNTYPYLSKRIFTQNQNDIIINFIPLRQALKEYITEQHGNTGVYFEYLPSGTSIGVNDTEEVKLASLAKVPLVMSIFKKIERKKLTLSQNVTITQADIDTQFGTLWQKGAGTQLTVEELIAYTLTQSDNTAYNTLYDLLTPQEVNEPYDNLDIQLIHTENTILSSPKSYASIFRSLYLSSFLSIENSNYILSILTHTDFKDKIPAGVPESIPISHKIGVFDIPGKDDLFTDCGIVYVPNRPYIICTFVKGNDKTAQKNIATISKMIYGYIRQI